VFLTRIFHHDAVVVRGDAGITHPKQLEGRRVGVRAYTVTTGVWTRGLLQHEYGVDPAKVTWVTDDEEHVETFKPPPNVISAPVGRSLADLFQAGELDAAFTGNAGIGRAGPPREGWSREAPARPPSGAEGPRPLFADADERDRAWYQATGISPIHALVVVQDRLLVEHPRLATDLYVAFCEAKQARDPSTVDERWEKLVPIVGSDPLPYGVAANRTSLEALSAYACEQAIVPRAFDPRELLAAGTLET
jgi:4,5-dihydroxyphthalate decarboxylase